MYNYNMEEVEEKENLPTMVIDIIEFQPMGMEGKKSINFVVSLEKTEHIIGIYLKSKHRFEKLTIYNSKIQKGKVAVVYSWMIDSLITKHECKLDKKQKDHEDFISPIILCVENIFDSKENADYSVKLINMWLKYYGKLKFKFEFSEKTENKDVTLFIQVKRNPLGFVKSAGMAIGNASKAVVSSAKDLVYGVKGNRH